MSDYILAIGDRQPYGFSAANDDAAARHAAEYILDRHHADWSDRAGLAVVLSGPNGILTGSTEDVRAFCARVNPPLSLADTSDVRPGDPVTPDCNG